MDKNKSINIIAILHNEKNQILTIKKKVGHFKNYLSLPGGFVNFKERIEDTIKREVNEKLSLIIEPLDILLSVHVPMRENVKQPAANTKKLNSTSSSMLI